MSYVDAYWEMEKKLPAVCDWMSQDRFRKLLTLIHFQDNLNVSDDAKINCGYSGPGYKKCKNNFSAYLLKNVMQSMKLWCHSRENLI